MTEGTGGQMHEPNDGLIALAAQIDHMRDELRRANEQANRIETKLGRVVEALTGDLAVA